MPAAREAAARVVWFENLRRGDVGRVGGKNASLGEMVSQSSSLASTAWWTLVGPSLAIVIAVIGFNFLGDGLRDAADPRTRTRAR